MSLSLILLGQCGDGAVLDEREQAKQAQCEGVHECGRGRVGASAGAGVHVRGDVHEYVHSHAYVGTGADVGDDGGGVQARGRAQDVRGDKNGRVLGCTVRVAPTLAID